MKDNYGLIKHAEMALKNNWGYVWGTFGQICDTNLLQQKCRQYPKEVGGKKIYILNNYMNKRVADCIGLIKAYIWEKNGKINYNPSEDLSADMAFNLAKEKGPISTMPEIKGLCVRFPGHVGIYIGKGEVIEAKGTYYGVIKTNLKERPWTHWYKHPHINYNSGNFVELLINGEDFKIKGQNINGRHYVELRALLEKLGYEVKWENKKVIIKG